MIISLLFTTHFLKTFQHYDINLFDHNLITFNTNFLTHFLFAQPCLTFYRHIRFRRLVQKCARFKSRSYVFTVRLSRRLLRQNKNKIHSFHLKITTASLTNLIPASSCGATPNRAPQKRSRKVELNSSY